MRCPFCGHDRLPGRRLTSERPGDAVRRRRRVPLLRAALHHLRALRRGPALHPQARTGARAVRPRQGAGRARAGRDQAPGRARAARGAGRPDRRRAARRGRHARAPSEVGELALRGLRELDPVAYVRFASVYRKFEDVDGVRARAGAARVRAAAAARAPVRDSAARSAAARAIPSEPEVRLRELPP